MVKYRVAINRDLCISCGITAGQCPTHARTLSRLLNKHSSQGTIAEDYLAIVKKAVDSCPVGAINLEPIE